MVGQSPAYLPCRAGEVQEMPMSRPSTIRAPFLVLAGLVAFCSLIAAPASAMEKGKVFLTQGLVCDRPSYVDAVITLADNGDDLQGAINQVNAGAAKPRCIAGMLVVARYIDKARTFFTKDSVIHVHKVKVVGFAEKNADGVVPKKLARPVTQYVFSMEKAIGI
jgi:hypothetical protein